MNGRIGSILARCFIHSVKYPTWEGRKVGRNGNWVMSAKVVGGEGPGGTRLESIEASRWKKEEHRNEIKLGNRDREISFRETE